MVSMKNQGSTATLRAFVVITLSALLVACGASGDEQTPPESGPTSGVVAADQVRYGMVIHGGAGTIVRENLTPELETEYRAKLTEALRAGYQVLNRGGSSLDAVEAAIHVMEDSPIFNSGRGAVFTHDGRNSLDAAIMDGRSLMAGAVSGVEDVKNPISLARLVMEQSPHVMLSGRGAEEFARLKGIPSTPKDYFFTERRWQSLEDAKERENATEEGDGRSSGRPDAVDNKFGTVGAIALDQSGGLAAGTSTGGMTNKRWDRIGDAPIVGAGTYADAECAISGTGWGEYFIRNVVAHDICARRLYTEASLAEAAHQVIMEKLEAQQENTGGIIGMDHEGHVVMPFNTAGMYRGWIDEDGNVTVLIYALGAAD